MLPSAELASFVIADISGYTNFVSGVELDHAQDIIADIMDTLVRALRPPFRLAKFEGDAAFVYALADKVDGSLLQDSIEQAYFAFRKRLRNIKQANSCECRACSRMQNLDVKFVVHHGEFIRQKMAGREELAGRDVILVHRLLKNDVVGRSGPRLRAVFRRLHPGDGDRLQRAGSRRALRGDRSYRRNEVLGQGPEEAWSRESGTTRECGHRAEAIAVIETDFAAPRPAVWEHVALPAITPAGREATASSKTQSKAGAAPARRTIACTARTLSSRTSSTGVLSTM